MNFNTSQTRRKRLGRGASVPTKLRLNPCHHSPLAVIAPLAVLPRLIGVLLLLGSVLLIQPLPATAQEQQGTRATAAATKSFSIRVSGGPNGSVSPKGTRKVRAGGKAEYTITPKKGYLIDTLTVNGATPKGLPKAKGRPYTLRIAKVSENLKVVASFAKSRTVRPLALGSQVSVVDPK